MKDDPDSTERWRRELAKASERFVGMVGQMMEDTRFTSMERQLLLYELGLETRAFRIALWKVLFISDPVNLARFEQGFPDEVDAVRAWRHRDLANRARAIGLEV